MNIKQKKAKKEVCFLKGSKLGSFFQLPVRPKQLKIFFSEVNFREQLQEIKASLLPVRVCPGLQFNCVCSVGEEPKPIIQRHNVFYSYNYKVNYILILIIFYVSLNIGVYFKGLCLVFYTLFMEKKSVLWRSGSISQQIFLKN